MAEDFNYFLNKAINITPTSDDIKKATKVNAIDQLKQDAIAQAEPKVVKEAKAKSRPFSLGVGEEGLYDVPSVSESVANKILWLTDDPKFLQKNKTVRLGFPGLIQAVPGWAGAVPLGMAPGLSHLTGGDDQIIPRQERKINPEDNTLYWTQGEIPKPSITPVVHKSERQPEWRSALQLKSQTKQDVLDSSLVTAPATKSDVLIKEFKKAGKIAAETGMNIYAAYNNAMAGLGRILEQGEEEEGTFATFIKKAYQAEAQRAKANAERVAYTPSGVIDSANKKIIQGALGLLDPALLLMGAPVGYGTFQFLSALGSGADVPESLKKGVESGVVAKAFKQAGGLPSLEAGLKVGTVAATEGLEAPGGLGEKRDAAIESFITTGLFAALGASKKGAVAEKVYGRYAPILGHEKALEISRRTDNYLRGFGFERDLLAMQLDDKEKIFDDILTKSAVIGSKMRGEVEVEQKEKVKKSKKSKKAKEVYDKAMDKASTIDEKSTEEDIKKAKEEAKKVIEEEIPLEEDEITDSATDSVTGLSNDKAVHYTTKSLNELFSQSLEETKEKTDNLASLIDDEMWSPTVNVHSYVQTLINEVNRWYHKFEGTDIEQTRRKLSDLASRVEELRKDFTDFIDPVTGEKVNGEEVFNDFKEMVRRAAEWARRMKKQSEVSETTNRPEGEFGTVKDIKFYSGIPFDKIKELLEKADFIRLFHGSGREFEEFRDEMLRTGQGAQARGSGHYLAEDKEVARGYAKEYGKPEGSYVVIDNITYNTHPETSYFFTQYFLHKISKDELISNIEEAITRSKNSLDMYKKGKSGRLWMDVPVEEIRLKDLIREKELVINSNKIESIKEPTLYTISIKGGFQNKKWLDWDNPIGYTVAKLIKSQWNKVLSDKNAKIFKEANGKMFLNPADIDSSTLGSVVHQVLTYAFKDKFVIRPGVREDAMTRVSKFLKEAGITGTMFDADTIAKSGTGKGTKNYVVYDPNDIKIERITRDRDATKLYSGLPLDELKKVSDYFKDVFGAKARREAALADQRSTQRMRDFFTRFLGQSYNVKRELMIHAADKGGYEAMAALSNARSSSSRSANLAFQAEREVFGGLKKEHEEILWKILFAARTRQIIDNNTEAKNPRGLGRDYWQGYLDNICEIEKIDRATADELIKRSDAAFSILKDTLKQGYEEGLYTKEDYENLKNFSYLTRQRLDKLDPETYKVYGGLLGKTKLAIRDSGLEELSVGSEGQLLEVDARRLLREHIIRIQNRIMANRAAKTLYELAKADKDNPIVKIKHTEKVPVGKATMKVKEKIPAGWKEINCWIDGKKKAVYMPGYLADEWITGSREITPELSNWIRSVSGSNILRSMATGVNVGFALKNLPRDLAMMWFASNHYVKGVGWKKTFSPYLPVAAWQIAKNVAKVGPDVIMRRGIYNEMVEQGVLLDFLSNRDRITKERLGKSNKYVDAMLDAFHYIGTTSELIGRATLYSRAKEKGLSKSEASYLAKDYLYFGDYGTYTKAIDAAIPYFGASIKATESIFRSWARNPVESAIQAVQVVGLGMLLHSLNQNSNDEAYKRIPDRERQANWILPVYIPYTDKNGKQEYWYMKIPKDPGQAFFSAVGAYAIDFMTGKDTDSDKIVTSLKVLSPINQVPVPPTLEATLSYLLNKNFWTYDEIWPGGEAGAITGLEGEHRETGNRPTNPALTKLGSVTGLSPERMRVALEAVFTSGNIYTDAFSSSARALFDNLPPEAKESFTAQMLKSSTLKGFFGTTEFMNEFNEKNREIKVEEKKRESIVNNELSTLIEHAPDKVDAYIDKIDNPDEQDRVQRRAEFETAINKLPHKSLWRQLYSAGSPEAAAKMYYNVTKDLSIENSEALNDELESISEYKQIMTDRFIDEYNRLDDESKGLQ